MGDSDVWRSVNMGDRDPSIWATEIRQYGRQRSVNMDDRECGDPSIWVTVMCGDPSIWETEIRQYG